MNDWLLRQIQVLRWTIAQVGCRSDHAVAAAGLLFRQLLSGVRKWWQGRRVHLFLQGVPSLAAFLLILVFLIARSGLADEEVAGKYHGVGRAAFESGDYATALIAYERLARHDPDRLEYRFGLAATAEQVGNHDRCLWIMSRLARPDQQGFPPAHIWWAKHMLASKLPHGPRLAEIHLRRALQGQPHNAEAHALLGQLYLASHHLAEAELHLLEVVFLRPDLELALARLYHEKADRPKIEHHAHRAERYYREKAEKDIDNHQARLAWAEAALLLGDYPKAAGILKRGVPSTAEHSLSYRLALARVYVAWHDSLVGDPANLAQRLALLEQALRVHNGYVPGLVRILRLTQAEDEAAVREAQAGLRRLLAEGKLAATAHLLLGLSARKSGALVEARQHFEKAYQLSPQAEVVIHNLARTLAQSERPDLAQAMQLIEAVIERAPDNPLYRQTRGEILVRMKRWSEALPDLEAALPLLRGNLQLHRSLAEVYRRLGNEQMAAEHDRLAARNAGRP